MAYCASTATRLASLLNLTKRAMVSASAGSMEVNRMAMPTG